MPFNFDRKAFTLFGEGVFDRNVRILGQAQGFERVPRQTDLVRTQECVSPSMTFTFERMLCVAPEISTFMVPR